MVVMERMQRRVFLGVDESINVYLVIIRAHFRLFFELLVDMVTFS